MENFKEFQGKSLDEAIRNACAYYDASREKLEIDIVQDAKNGIFGLVGARKAVIRARRARLQTSMSSLWGRNVPERKDDVRPREVEPGRESAGPARSAEADVPAEHSRKKPLSEVPAGTGERMPAAPETAPQPASVRSTGEGGSEKSDFEPDQEENVEYASVSFADLDKDKLVAAGTEAAEKLITPILGPVHITVTPGEGRLDVHVDCGEDSGLLIGREGQTLAALQYLASRIVSRAVNAPVRMQFDVGDYRERQDERLRELALSLAERVRSTGRSCSTRPLSSYHRRIIHLALQNMPDVQTRSSGDGPLKRVIVLRRRPGFERRDV